MMDRPSDKSWSENSPIARGSLRRTRRARWRGLASVSLLLLFTGCGLGVPSFLQSSDPPLAGDRIPVLLNEDIVVPDAAIANQQVILPPPQMEFDWPQQGGSPAHSMAHGIVSDAPEEVWSRDIGRGSDSDETLLSGPVVAGGIIYAIDTSAVVSAFDAGDGELIWEAETELREERDGGWGGGIAASDGRLFVTTGFADVIALDAITGEEIWRVGVSAPIRSSPTIDNGRVFVLTRSNKLIAFSADNGARLWDHSGFFEGAGLLGASSPAVFGDVVVVTYSSGEIFALNVQTGAPFWSDTLATVRQVDTVSAISDIRGRPVISGGRVYVASHSGRIAAYVLSTSAQLWELNFGSVTQPWVAGNYVFVTTLNGEVAAIKADSGLIRWVTRIGEFENERRRRGLINWTGPVLAGDRLIVAGSNGEVLSLSPYTGELLGTMRIRGGVSLAPIVVQETLYFLTDSARLFAYR